VHQREGEANISLNFAQEVENRSNQALCLPISAFSDLAQQYTTLLVGEATEIVGLLLGSEMSVPPHMATTEGREALL
jgi:hypothetical protein